MKQLDPNRPNILVIMSDDHARWAAGCYGNSELRTPTLDHLADTGVKFDNAFCNSPVCSPARASFFTGLTPSQHGIHDFIQSTDDTYGDVAWLKDEVTLAERLKNAGYRTGLVGKWHCGQDERVQPGFDDWFSVGRTYPYHGGPHHYADNGVMREINGYKTPILTDRAAQFLEQDSSQPFFLFVGYTGTHSPWEGHPERLVSAYRQATFGDILDEAAYPLGRLAGETSPSIQYDPREALAQYYAAVSHVDEGVGRLLDTLESCGLRDNTLVVYTSDHGLNTGHHGIWGKGNGTRPYNMLEESVRVPLIFNAPFLYGGQTRAEFSDHTDLFETLVDLGGADFGRAGPHPGRSLAPTLLAAQPPPTKPVQVCEYGTLRMARDDRYKLLTRPNEAYVALFDLENDPRETKDVCGRAGYEAVIKRLTLALEAYFESYSRPDKSGLELPDLPPQNSREVWREPPY